jgi:flagellin-like hook-associated protein FlgL
MRYARLNGRNIHVIDQTGLINSLDSKVKQSVLKTTISGFVQQYTNDDYNISNVIASKNAAYQYKNYSSIRESVSNDLVEYQAAQDNFNSIKGKVGEIKSLLKSAHDGTLTGTALDDAQEEINELVAGINRLVSTTTVGGKKIFDGAFKQQLQEDLSGNSTLTVDFTRASDISRPLAVTASLTPINDHENSLQVLYSDSKYIVASTQNDANGEANPIDFGNNGSVQIYDAVTKNLIREIKSPLTSIDNERFGYAVSVDGDNILIGTRIQGYWDPNGDGNNDWPEYDRDFSGGAFLYDIPSGNLITSFTKDALAAKNPLVDLGLRSENDVSTNLSSVNKYSSFGEAVKIKGNSVFIAQQNRAGNLGQDNRPGGQGALAVGGIQEFTLDGTFVKQYDSTGIDIDIWSTDAFQVTDDYIIVGTGWSGNPGFTRDGRVTLIDRNTETVRTLKSSNQASFKSFGHSVYAQGNQLIVGESGGYVAAVHSGLTMIGVSTADGYVDAATWNTIQNNGGGIEGFGGAVHVYDIDKLMTEYDAVYNAAITAGQTVSQAETTATNAISSTSSEGYIRSFDKATLAAQGLDLDRQDDFGYKVKLDGTNAIIHARYDDSTAVNGGATYVFDITTGEFVTKADGINYHAAAGEKLYQGVSGTTIQEYDFSSILGAPTNGLDINTGATKSATLGAKSSSALNNLTVSTNVASLGGSTGLVNDQSLVDIDQIESNLIRMEASLKSMVKRVSNSLGRIDDKMNILKDRKSAVDLNLGGYFNASNINIQIANPRKAVDLLP